MHITTILFFLASLLGSLGAVNAVADEQQEMLRAAVAKLAPGAKVDAIVESVVPGMYEVEAGATVWYITADGRFLIDGDIYDIDKRLNLSAAKREKGRAKAIDAIGEERMIVFSPENPEHTVTVFTDVDCGYCRKLHREIDQYTDAGIKIRYLMYPRAGVGSSAYKKAVSSWCAKDRKATLTRAKNGQSIEDKSCENPVRDHMALGESLGITGTPTMVMEDGEMVPGYVPASQLKKMLQAKSKN